MGSNPTPSAGQHEYARPAKWQAGRLRLNPGYGVRMGTRGYEPVFRCLDLDIDASQVVTDHCDLHVIWRRVGTHDVFRAP